jgi:hypothetical protein
MKKLTQRKIRWIIREIEKRALSIYRIAKLQYITPRWVRELNRRHTEAGAYPYPKRPGRKSTPIPDVEKRVVIEMYQKHPVCAVVMEKIFDAKGIHIPHNRLHRIMKEQQLAQNQPKKQRRRKRWNTTISRDRT